MAAGENEFDAPGLEDGTDEQIKLLEGFIFQEAGLQMGFQSETYCVNKQSCI